MTCISFCIFHPFMGRLIQVLLRNWGEKKSTQDLGSYVTLSLGKTILARLWTVLTFGTLIQRGQVNSRESGYHTASCLMCCNTIFIPYNCLKEFFFQTFYASYPKIFCGSEFQKLITCHIKILSLYLFQVGHTSLFLLAQIVYRCCEDFRSPSSCYCGLLRFILIFVFFSKHGCYYCSYLHFVYQTISIGNVLWTGFLLASPPGEITHLPTSFQTRSTLITWLFSSSQGFYRAPIFFLIQTPT